MKIKDNSFGAGVKLHEGYGNMTTIDEFNRRGGTVKHLPPKERPSSDDPQYGSPFNDCADCPHYRSGNGDRLCLRCKQYEQFKVKSTPRPKLFIESIPQAILEAIEDTPKLSTILSVIKTLPLEKSTPLMQQYFLGASLQEVAKYHNISKQRVDAKNKLSIVIIKETLTSG